jgi:hypothetical protein
MMKPEPYSVPHPDTRDVLKKTLDRIELCRYAIQEAHYEVEAPADPELKADLLLAVEALTFEAIDLLQTTKLYVWGPEEDDEED